MLSEALVKVLVKVLDDHRRGESSRECIEGLGWVWACWCECDWQGRDRDHDAHLADALAPVVEQIVAARVEAAVERIAGMEGVKPSMERQWLRWAQEAAHAPLSDDEESPRVYPPETGVERGSEAREDDAWLRRSLAHLVEHASGDTIRVGVLEALLRTTGEDEGGGL